MLRDQVRIEEKGFNLVSVEGDWPDCYRVNRYVKEYPGAGESARDVLHAFKRWPTWMWANWEIVAFYDAFLYIDGTEALHPLHIEPEELRPPDTYPWGV